MHGAGIVDQQGHHRVAKRAVPLLLERKWQEGVNDNARKAACIELSLLLIKVPGSLLLCHQVVLQPIG
ncbi:hypothetical protein D3C86_1675920 [compost metagenome]